MSESDLEAANLKINQEKEFLNAISLEIWKNPEISYTEVFAHDILTAALLKYGFDVQKNYLLPTAFRAEYSSKNAGGPIVAVLLEYDALPIIGHGCGHNLIAEAGLAAGIGIKAAMDADSSIKGKVVVLGTPAEEGGGGKVEMIKQGAFKDIDIAMMVHPTNCTLFFPPTLSRLSFCVDFKGRETHAAVFPWEGLNALDAAVTFYQSVGLLRQQIKPSHRIHAIITKGGTVPNVIPADTQLKFYVRAPTKKEMNDLKSRVENCIKGAAVSTGCSYSVTYDEIAYVQLVTNPVVGKLFGSFAEKLGLPETDTSNMSERLGAATDMGNVSQVVPSIHPVYDINTEASNHTKDFTDASGSPLAQEPTLIAAKAMAMTVLSLFRNPGLVVDAKSQFEEQRKSFEIFTTI